MSSNETLEIEKKFKDLTEEELRRKAQQWIKRIEQFILLNKDKKAKELYKELKVIANLIKKKKMKVLSDKYQKDILSDESIEDKLAKYYKKFGNQEIVEQPIQTMEEAEDPSKIKEKIKEEGYTLAILKSLKANKISGSDFDSISFKNKKK